MIDYREGVAEIDFDVAYPPKRAATPEEEAERAAMMATALAHRLAVATDDRETARVRSAAAWKAAGSP